MLCIEDIRGYCSDETIVLTEHLLTRMKQRHIRYDDIKQSIAAGEIIEHYPNDYPFPSCLVNAENMHIVCSISEGRLFIITAYRPSAVHWEAGGKKRREKKL
jgi:hypothetical protein